VPFEGQTMFMSRFRIHFLEFGFWMATILEANDDQSALEAFGRLRPCVTVLGLHKL
jgi:hypothetical protein